MKRKQTEKGRFEHAVSVQIRSTATVTLKSTPLGSYVGSLQPESQHSGRAEDARQHRSTDTKWEPFNPLEQL
jgi:hypothetical protein